MNLVADAAKPALHRIRKYLSAVGRFGRSPFLLAQYGGIGEIIQGFCRYVAHLCPGKDGR